MVYREVAQPVAPSASAASSASACEDFPNAPYGPGLRRRDPAGAGLSGDKSEDILFIDPPPKCIYRAGDQFYNTFISGGGVLLRLLQGKGKRLILERGGTPWELV